MDAEALLKWILETKFIDIVDSRTEDIQALETVDEITQAMER